MRILLIATVVSILGWTSSAAAGDLHLDWSRSPDRPWAGRVLWTNRMQDWRIENERLECHERREDLPVRTAQVLTHALDGAGRTTIRVRTGTMTAGSAPAASRWRGVLIGAGGAHVDYRISALVHHRPAADGGLLCYVDASGRVSIRDFSRTVAGGNQWAMGGAVEEAAMPTLADGAPPDFDAPDEVLLEVIIDADAQSVEVVARTAQGRELSRAALPDADPQQLDGAVALMSHRGAHWFDDFSVVGATERAERRFGPIVQAMYTVSRETLSITTQLVPLGPEEHATVVVEVGAPDAPMRRVAEVPVEPDSWTATARLDDWDPAVTMRYRVSVELADGGDVYEGTIRAAPSTDRQFVLASLNCQKSFTGALQWNGDSIWFPHVEIAEGVMHHDPDLLYFAGDQIYEGDLTGADRRSDETALLDYLQKWYRWCWSFRDVTRTRPTVTIPDDHDVYHGNIWGAGGRQAQRTTVNGRRLSAQDSGGYVMSERFVNAVHRTQVGHLPPPVDPRPIERGITVYYTDLTWGGISFAILADRMFKSAPALLVPDGEVVNGWFQAEGFDPRRADTHGAQLLGSRQERFLEEWAVDLSGDAWMKVVLSQTPFANIATLPAGAKNGSVLPSLPIPREGDYPEDHWPVADTDSGGWPQTARNRAIRAMRRGFALHLSGDQHLGSLIQYGTEGFGDSGFSFCAPAIANTWPRRWFPAREGGRREPGAPRYTGNYFDGFGNRMTVYAVSNPAVTGREPARLHDRAPGYGIVRFDERRRRITMECWRRGSNPAVPGDPDAQYPGWPRAISQLDNFPPKPLGWLPTLVFEAGDEDRVVQVIDEAGDDCLYAIRNNARRFRPWIPSRTGTYTLRVSDGDDWLEWTGLGPEAPGTSEIRVE